MHKIKANIDENPLKKIKVRKVIYPIIIGLAVVGYLFYKKFNPNAFDVIVFTKWSVFWLIIAFCFMGLRDFGYMLRLRVLTENMLNFRQSFKVIMLWEFSSAILPSAFGGTMVATIYVNKEGVNVGKSSAVVMITSFLDELYFILVFPILLVIITPTALFGLGVTTGISTFSQDIFIFCIIGYLIKFVWVVMLSYGLFINPRGLKWLLMLIFKLPLLRKWKHGANRAGTDIIQSSIEFRKKPFGFWLKAFGTTFISWTSRYCVVNALLLAFFAVNNHVLIFVRQLAMSIIQLISPTPGGSGSSEYIFTRYLGEFIPVDPAMLGSIVIAMAFLWRMISYYPYLLIGAIIFPRWIKEKFVKKVSPEIKSELI
ncbi:MAG: flippase-like domain-containing protein [Bacteroidales bacterium]|nr:flippase-like domain-containing protein [Bacteroidales bacterium]